jgi:hypothetical protein
MDEEIQENRREYIRFELHVPLFAELSLARVQERELKSRTQRVLLNDISLGGCQFKTYLLIPARSDVEWSFKLQLGKYFLNLKAIIVRSAQEDGFYVYGVCWKMTNFERHALHYRLNEYLFSVLVSSPHILTLYRKIVERKANGHFRGLDITSKN